MEFTSRLVHNLCLTKEKREILIFMIKKLLCLLSCRKFVHSQLKISFLSPLYQHLATFLSLCFLLRWLYISNTAYEVYLDNHPTRTSSLQKNSVFFLALQSSHFLLAYFLLNFFISNFDNLLLFLFSSTLWWFDVMIKFACSSYLN